MSHRCVCKTACWLKRDCAHVLKRTFSVCVCVSVCVAESVLKGFGVRGTIKQNLMGQSASLPMLLPGDIVEFPRNKYFSHFGIYYGEMDGVPYVAHLTSRDSEAKLLLFGRALRSEVKLDPVLLLGNKYKVNNMLDGSHPVRDFVTEVKPAIDHMLGQELTFDILFHNSEHQATLFRYGVKRSQQIQTVYKHIMPAWEHLLENKKL